MTYTEASDILKSKGYSVVHKKLWTKQGNENIEKFIGVEIPLITATIDDHVKKIRSMFPTLNVSYDGNSFSIVIE